MSLFVRSVLLEEGNVNGADGFPGGEVIWGGVDWDLCSEDGLGMFCEKVGEGDWTDEKGCGMIRGYEGMYGVVKVDAVIDGTVAVSQVAGASGDSDTLVPGSKSTGCSSRCSMKVTWKELKSFPLEGSHSR